MFNYGFRLNRLTIVFSLILLILACGLTYGQDSTKAVKKSKPNKELFFLFDYPKPNTKVFGKITIGGRHNHNLSAKIWIVLSDGHGFYLQSPAVTLTKKTWVHDNIHLGGGIKSIRAILVDEKGHTFFLAKVKNKEWGQFKELPKNHEVLSILQIRN